jgi:hypothetical protein
MTPFEIILVFLAWLITGAGVLTTAIARIDGPWWLRASLGVIGIAILAGLLYWAGHVFPPIAPGTHIIVV